MNLRKDQRLTVYIIMRAEMERADLNFGFFSVLGVFDLYTSDLPELQKAWKGVPLAFDKKSKARRLSILDQCIEQTLK